MIERGYSERMVKTQILKARRESSDSLLKRGNTRTSESNVKSILEELQVLLTKEQKKCLPEVSGFFLFNSNSEMVEAIRTT